MIRRMHHRRSTGSNGLSRFRTVMGIPLSLVLAALLMAVLLGIQLASALEQGTGSSLRTGSASVSSNSGPGKNDSGLPVLTESTLGLEVQRLVDSGAILPVASFDAARCLQEQGIPDSVLIMEEVAWGPEETTGWLIVHGPMNRDTLRDSGGTVSATVVLPGCGTDSGQTPEQTRLWSGSVMIGSM